MINTKTIINGVTVNINFPKVWCDYCGKFHTNGLDCYEEDLVRWNDD